MLLAELLMRKKYVDLKIAELKSYLFSDNNLDNINEILGELYNLEDQKQKYRVLIKKANDSIEVKIGSSKVPLSTAIELRDNLDNKINIISDLISVDKKSLDIFNLFEQRSNLVEEYMMIYSAIKISEWSTNID